MVLKLRNTLHNSAHQNGHFLAFSDCQLNEVPASDSISPPVGLPLLLLVTSLEINRCLVDSGSNMWERILETFRFFAYLYCSRLISDPLIPLPGLYEPRRGVG